ncbi:MAG: class I SAM-dependent methyltransferase [Dehalococcoidia bacterium]
MTTGSGQTPRQGAEQHNESDEWQKQEFVDAWVTRDDGRQDQRQPMVKEAIALLPFDKGSAISALDVGAGYGVLSAELLRNFPKAAVTLQDVSEPMFSHARERLAEHASQLTFVQSDFSLDSWAEGIQGPFDVVISAIAIHNLYDDGGISRVYKDVCGLLGESGMFVNLDYAGQAGGVDAHIAWLKEGGFARVECTPVTDRISLLSAFKKA